MSTDLLFEQFATLATAPDGIGRLRELILQLAVQGKLGTQDSGDEPAIVLLEKIRKEKTRLINNGDIKRTDQFLPVDHEECQYEIPDGWQWTRLGTLVADSKQDIVDGPFGSDLHSAEYVDSGVPVIRLQNVQRNQFLNKNIRFLTSDKAEYLSRHNFVSGDIVITKLGEPVGKACIVPEYLKSGIFVADIIRIRLDSRFVDTNYITFMINSPFISVKFNGLVKGITRARVNLTKVREMVIPLPPLAEQHRIVAKVDRLMALCDELEARQQNERAGCLKLGTASLAGLQNAENPEECEAQWAQVCDAFDLILDCPENVAVLRQTILQIAVQGWLTNNKSSMINGHPKNWKLASLSDIIIDKKNGMRTGPFGSMLKKYEHLLSGVPVFGIENVKKMKFLPYNKVFISEEKAKQLKNYDVKFNDILITRSGTVGEICVVPDGIREARISSNLMRLRLNLEVCDPHFLCLILYGSKSVLDKIDEQCVGSTRTFIDGKILKSLTFPLPPLSEQHRIVVKVDALMALCDALESRLEERAGVQERLAGAVVKQVAG